MNPKPHFSFPDIPSFKNYTFEKLNEENFEQLYLLFENDSSPFVDEQFKTYEAAKEYAKYISVCGPYSSKHGCNDWLFKLPNGEYAGILHLYDLSLETFGNNNQRVWVGFAIQEKFRNKGITSEVVQYFINYIFRAYTAINFIHAMTRNENIVAQNFLHNVGFSEDKEPRLSKNHKFYLLSRPQLS